MSSKFPLQTLLDLSNVRLDDAAKRLGELIASEQQAGQRLELLTTYRNEYQDRFLAAAQNGLRPDEWNNYRAFLDRLEEAIGQARDAVQYSQQKTSVGKQEWIFRQGKVKAFDTLSERHDLREQHKELRVEQKLMDEYSARNQRSKPSQD